MKNILSILSVAVLINAGVALACGGKTCEPCEGKTKESSQTAKSVRKPKCTKCAGHEEDEQKADAKHTETAPSETTSAKS